MRSRTLYHVTHRRNVASILDKGLMPARSKTRWRTLWYTNEQGIQWAIKHVMERHGYKDPRALVVIKVQIPIKDIKNNRWSGIYNSHATVPVTTEMITNATDSMREE